MRTIDADALTKKYGDWYVEEGTEEGFIGTLGQLLSVQPETNCSEIPNNSDTISRQQSIDALRKMQTYKLFEGDDMILIDKAQVQTELMMLPSVQPESEAISKWKKEFREYVDSLDIKRDDWKGIIEYIDELPSIQPDVIRCKDCINYIDHRCTVADHHVAPFSCCQSVFGAKMKAGE